MLKTRLTVPSVIVNGLLVYLLINISGCSESYTASVDSAQKISETSGNFASVMVNGDRFGSALSSMGDLEGDGVTDLAAGTPYDDTNGTDKGAVWILFLDSNGQVDIKQKIAESTGGFTAVLNIGDRFGSALANLGDLDNDGVNDLAVGAPGDDDGGTDRGAVWIIYLNADGTVKQSRKISMLSGGFAGALDNSDQFGFALANAGDINGDGVNDLAVGAPGDDDGGTDAGAVWVLFLNTDGTVSAQQKVSDQQGNFTAGLTAADRFGSAIVSTGDIDKDGQNDLVVGAPGDDDGGFNRGAAWILYLDSAGNVLSSSKISDSAGMFEGILADGDEFGSSLANPGDLNGDGVSEILVGAPFDDTAGIDRGAVWVLFMSGEGEVISESRITQGSANFSGSLTDNNGFGISLSGLGDLNGDGNLDFAVGANQDDDGGTDRGALWILFMAPVEINRETDSARFESTDNFIFTEAYR